MIDHEFQTVFYHRLGPMRNNRGIVFSVAEIGSVWLLTWVDFMGLRHSRYYSDYEAIGIAIKQLDLTGRVD